MGQMMPMNYGGYGCNGMNPAIGCGVPPACPAVVKVDKAGRILPNKEDDNYKSMMGMVQKTMMLE